MLEDNTNTHQSSMSSFERLDAIRASSTERVTQFRVLAEQREAKRRDEEAEDNVKRHDLIQQINDMKEDEAVEAGWEECKSATNAQDLAESLKKQNANCQLVVTKLDDIAKQIGSQLRQKDHEYVAALKRNRQEIEMLQTTIEREHSLLKDAFEQELKLIEKSLNADKARILEERQGELDALMKERNDAELRSLTNQLAGIDQHRSDLKAAEVEGDANASALQEELEAELKRLELRLEDTKARHQFESDKLEFDVRVLDELSNNAAEIAKQKKRIMKGKEELNRCIEARHREQERGAKDNQALEDDCERIERQCNGLKEKFERFRVSDNDKFQAILSLHNADLQQLQDELEKSRDCIFGEEIGCREADFNEGGKREKLADFGLLDDAEPKDSHESDEWEQAETLMTNYKAMLEKREDLDAEVRELEERNAALEEEINARLNDEVNEELAFPPSSMIGAEDAGETT